jgi:hypothetical protein
MSTSVLIAAAIAAACAVQTYRTWHRKPHGEWKDVVSEGTSETKRTVTMPYVPPVITLKTEEWSEPDANGERHRRSSDGVNTDTLAVPTKAKEPEPSLVDQIREIDRMQTEALKWRDEYQRKLEWYLSEALRQSGTKTLTVLKERPVYIGPANEPEDDNGFRFLRSETGPFDFMIELKDNGDGTVTLERK